MAGASPSSACAKEGKPPPRSTAADASPVDSKRPRRDTSPPDSVAEEAARVCDVRDKPAKRADGAKPNAPSAGAKARTMTNFEKDCNGGEGLSRNE